MRGLVYDVPPEEVPPDSWSGGRNVYFDNGDQSTKRAQGYRPQLTTGKPAGFVASYGMQVTLPDGAVRWLFVGMESAAVKVYVASGAQWWDITPVGGLSAYSRGLITGTQINGFPVINLGNGIDIPYYWDLQTSNPMVTLPDWDANWRCGAIRSFKYHLFAMDMTETSIRFPNRVRWSAAAEPGTVPQLWTAAADNDAGDIELPATIGRVIDAQKLRDSLMIFKQNSTYICTYTGGTFVFQFRKFLEDEGVNSPNQSLENEGWVYWFSGDDFMRTDGQSIEQLATEKMRRYMVGGINPDEQQMVQIVDRHVVDELWVLIPEVGQTEQTLCFIFNTRSNDWGLREVPNTHYVANGLLPVQGAVGNEDPWDSQTIDWNESNEPWNLPAFSATSEVLLMLADNGSLYELGNFDLADTADIPAFVQRESLPFGDMQRLKTITEVWPRIIAQAGQVFSITVGVQQYYDDPISWCPSETFTVSDAPQKIDVHCTGRFFSFKFETLTGGIWKIHGFKVDYTEAGKYA